MPGCPIVVDAAAQLTHLGTGVHDGLGDVRLPEAPAHKVGALGLPVGPGEPTVAARQGSRDRHRDSRSALHRIRLFFITYFPFPPEHPLSRSAPPQGQHEGQPRVVEVYL